MRRTSANASPEEVPRRAPKRSVRLVFESGRPIAHVARDLGIHHESLRRWVRQAEADCGGQPELLTNSERERLKALEREVKELRRANEIFNASVFLPPSSTRPDRGERVHRGEPRSLRGRADLSEPGGVCLRLLSAGKKGARSARQAEDERLLAEILQVEPSLPERPDDLSADLSHARKEIETVNSPQADITLSRRRGASRVGPSVSGIQRAVECRWSIIESQLHMGTRPTADEVHDVEHHVLLDSPAIAPQLDAEHSSRPKTSRRDPRAPARRGRGCAYASPALRHAGPHERPQGCPR